ncbi:hypothetical protein [Paraburkholderia sp. 2C]
MEIVDVVVEYPSGLTITDRANLARDKQHVYPSAKLVTAMFILSRVEASAAVSAIIDGDIVQLDRQPEGHFLIGRTLLPEKPASILGRILQPFLDPTDDQRQHFGRFCHTLSASAFLGAVGLWHATDIWTLESVKLEASLVLALVITFVRGMLSMRKGE